MEQKLKLLLEFEQRYWITKSNEKIQIKDLKLEHLENIVNFLKKKFNDMENPMNDYPSFDGEMAQMCADLEWRNNIQRYRQLEKNLQIFECYLKLKSL